MIYLCIASALLVGSVTHLRWRHLYGFLPVALIFVSELCCAPPGFRCQSSAVGNARYEIHCSSFRSSF